LVISISDHDIALEGYTVFRADRKSKGVRLQCKKSNFHATVLKSVSLKRFELLAIDLEYGKYCNLCIVGCYRPSTAISDAA